MHHYGRMIADSHDIADLRKRATCSVEEAGRVLGVHRSTAYDMAKRGVIPTISLGGTRKRVPTAAVLRMLGIDDTPNGEEPAPRELDA